MSARYVHLWFAKMPSAQKVGPFTAMRDNESVRHLSRWAHLYRRLSSILLEIPEHELGGQIIAMMETTELWHG
jgi:hypothetical protein